MPDLDEVEREDKSVEHSQKEHTPLHTGSSDTDTVCDGQRGWA